GRRPIAPAGRHRATDVPSLLEQCLGLKPSQRFILDQVCDALPEDGRRLFHPLGWLRPTRVAFQPGQPVPGVELDGTLACFVPVEHTRSSTDVEDVAALVAAVPEGGRPPSRAPATEGVEAPPRLSPQGGICA